MKHFSIAPRWACSYFFAVCGITYGSIMSRMPALKAQSGMSDEDVGIVLLCMGIGGLLSFPAAGWAIARAGCRKILVFVSGLLIILFPFLGTVRSFEEACLLFSLLGFGIGLNDVGINTESIIVESSMRRPVVSSMHALYSLGGLLGALFGSAMAASGLPPLWNFLAPAAVMLAVLPVFSRCLMQDPPQRSEKESRSVPMPPVWLIFTGLLLLCAYSTEGSVGEWGVILLHEAKGAGEETAALVYAAFSISMTAMRFFGDRLREKLGDRKLLRLSSAAALAGIACGIFSPWPAACLAGYAVLGAGLSVTVPILFGTLGSHDDIPTGTATAMLSMMAAGGQLFIPPLIGMLGGYVGLQTAMTVIVLLCFILLAGSGIVRPRK